MGKKLSAYNLHMKRSLKGKMRGKTKAQRKSIFKAAARAWKSKKKGNPKPRSKPKSRGSRRSSSTTRRSNRVGNKGINTQKIFKFVRWGALAAPAAGIIMSPMSNQRKIHEGVVQYFGYDTDTGTFDLNNLRKGWEPYFWSNVVTRVVPKVISFLTGVLG